MQLRHERQHATGVGNLTWANTGGLGGCDTPNTGVFCSNGDINIAPTVSTSICRDRRPPSSHGARGSPWAPTLRSTCRRPQRRRTTSSVAAYSNVGLASCMGGSDLNVGSAGTFSLQRQYLRPERLRAGRRRSVGGFTMTGSLVAKNIAMNPSPLTGWVSPVLAAVVAAAGPSTSGDPRRRSAVEAAPLRA